jgi:hypothetical protein
VRGRSDAKTASRSMIEASTTASKVNAVRRTGRYRRGVLRSWRPSVGDRRPTSRSSWYVLGRTLEVITGPAPRPCRRAWWVAEEVGAANPSPSRPRASAACPPPSLGQGECNGCYACCNSSLNSGSTRPPAS